MRVIQCEQGTQAWIDARLGIPTASCFDKILTPKTLKLSAQRTKYMHRILAEWITGESQDDTAWNSYIQRGTDLEAKARAWYEMQHDVDVQQVGFCVRDDGKVGASPDGLVGDDGGLEIKCPMAPQCVAYLLGAQVEQDHVLQIQGNLYVTGRAWWDVIAWNPYFQGVPPTVIRVERDEAVIEAIRGAVELFIAEIDLAKEYLTERGITPALG